MQTIDILTILQFGFFGSLGHCIGMCGGFIITYTSSKISPESSRMAQSFYHLFYNSGRISAYVILGALFGAFGSLWEATPFLRSIMFAFAGILMILMGFSLSGKIRFLNSIEYNLTNKKWYKNIFNKLIVSPNKGSFYFLGMLNGLFPCGLVYAALIWAMATGSALGGALTMLLFGLSTLPVLFSFGFFVGLLKQTTFRSIMVNIAALTVILFGAYTLYKSYMQYEYHQQDQEKALMAEHNNSESTAETSEPTHHSCH